MTSPTMKMNGNRPSSVAAAVCPVNVHPSVVIPATVSTTVGTRLTPIIRRIIRTTQSTAFEVALSDILETFYIRFGDRAI